MPIIRIMTFNVQGSTYPEEGPNSWASRAAVNVRTIKRYAPDLIGFQEVQSGNLATYSEELADYDHIAGNCYGDVEPTEYTSIFWKRERFELVESGQFWLSETPDEPSIGWGVPYPMGATWVKVRRKEDESELSRVEGSKLIAQRITQLQADEIAAIVTGDFNCNPWDEPYRIFVDNGFTDTYRAAGQGDSAASSTFHGFRGEEYFALEWGGEVYWRVDWVLARDGASSLRTTSCTIVRNAEPPLYPSDHYPMVSEVRLFE